MDKQSQEFEAYIKPSKPLEGGKKKGKKGNTNQHSGSKQFDAAFEKAEIQSLLKQQQQHELAYQSQDSNQPAKKLLGNELYRTAEVFTEEQKNDFEVKITQVKEIFGEQFTKKEIKNALRFNDMQLEETIKYLLQAEPASAKDNKQLIENDSSSSKHQRKNSNSSGSNSNSSYSNTSSGKSRNNKRTQNIINNKTEPYKDNSQASNTPPSSRYDLETTAAIRSKPTGQTNSQLSSSSQLHTPPKSRYDQKEHLQIQKEIKNIKEYSNMQLDQGSNKKNQKGRNNNQEYSKNSPPIQESTIGVNANGIQYGEKVLKIKSILNDIKEDLIIEALELHSGDIEETLDYLADENNVKSLCVSLQEHSADLEDVDDRLESILENICEEDEEREYKMLFDFLQSTDPHSNQDMNSFDMDTPDGQYFLKIQKSMSQEDQQNPDIQQSLNRSRIFLQQIDLFNQLQQLGTAQRTKSQDMTYDLEVFKEKIIEDDIQNKSDKKKFILKEADFPVMVEQAGKSKKNKQMEYNEHKNQWDANIAVFQTDIVSSYGRQCLQVISNKYPHVDNEILIDIFASLDEDQEATEKFLQERFGKSTHTTKVTIVSKEQLEYEQINDHRRNNHLKIFKVIFIMFFLENKVQAADSRKSYHQEEDEDQIIEETIRSMTKKYGVHTLSELRSNIQNMYRYNQALRFAEKNSDRNAQTSLNRYFAQQNGGMTQNDMKEYSKALFLKELRKTKPMNKIDLHGFYKEEALEVLKAQIMYLKKIAREGKMNWLQINGRHITLEIITGKGQNSINKQAVLRPLVIAFLDQAKYSCKAEEGRVFTKIPF